MLRSGKFGIAFALALMMSLSLLTSGAFAQSTKADHSNSARTAVVTTAPQAVQQTLLATTTQQATNKLGWGPGRGWRGGGGWRRGGGWRGGWGWRRGGGWRSGWGWRGGWGWGYRRFYRRRFFYGGCGC